MTSKRSSKITLLGLCLAIGTAFAAEEESGGASRAAVQNPISSLISLPFKFTFDRERLGALLKSYHGEDA
jgi:hypothetical protein